METLENALNFFQYVLLFRFEKPCGLSSSFLGTPRSRGPRRARRASRPRAPPPSRPARGPRSRRSSAPAGGAAPQNGNARAPPSNSFSLCSWHILCFQSANFQRLTRLILFKFSRKVAPFPLSQFRELFPHIDTSRNQHPGGSRSGQIPRRRAARRP